MTKAKKDNTAQRARTAANKARRLQKKANVKVSPLTKEINCTCGLVVRIKNYKVSPDKPYKCADCRGLTKQNEKRGQTTIAK